MLNSKPTATDRSSMQFYRLPIGYLFTRLIQLGMAISLIFGIFHLRESEINVSQAFIKLQQKEMDALLLEHTSYSLAVALKLEDDEQLQWLTRKVIQDPRIVSIIVYNSLGQRKSFASALLSKQITPDNPKWLDKLAEYPLAIQPIYQQQMSLGYVELRLDNHAFFQKVNNGIIEKIKQPVILILAAIVGILFIQVFSWQQLCAAWKKANKKGPQALKYD